MHSAKAKILIVEDEILLAQDLRDNYLSNQYEVIGIAASVAEAEKFLVDAAPDLLILDIMLRGNRDGIDLAAIVNDRYQIPFIFLTSYADKTLVARAKKVRPHAYLMKPFNEYEIPIAIELALSNYEKKRTPVEIDLSKEFDESENRVMNLRNSLFLKKDTAFQRVKLDDISLLEADNNYTTIFAGNERFIYSTVLKKIEEKLPRSTFMRVHRSYVINIKAIEGFEGNTLLVQSKRVPVSQQYREEVFKKLIRVL